MTRRDFLLGLGSSVAAAGLIGLDAGLHAARAGRQRIVYISARDCSYCRKWEAYDMDGFVASLRGRGVEFRRVEVMHYRDIRDQSYWPADLRPLLAQFNDKGGTPRFLVLDGDRIVMNVRGETGLRTRIKPLFT